ncbi:MAG: hypothetical protein WA858_09115, partial [Xanthobacteraceae bacterium]
MSLFLFCEVSGIPPRGVGEVINNSLASHDRIASGETFQRARVTVMTVKQPRLHPAALYERAKQRSAFEPERLDDWKQVI